MAKCAECGGRGNGKRLCGGCNGTGTEPPKVKLTEEQIDELMNADNGTTWKPLLEKIEEIINTAVNAERDRIMAGVDKIPLKDWTISEVKKKIGGDIFEEPKRKI